MTEIETRDGHCCVAVLTTVRPNSGSSPDRRTTCPPLSRRRLMLAASGLVAVAAAPRLVFIQAATAPAGPFKLDPLAYPVNALEPHIDAKTMEIHHDRHHQAYVTS